ncbi:hypothetical protein ACS0TY_017586 [Phlomoides rotata]
MTRLGMHRKPGFMPLLFTMIGPTTTAFQVLIWGFSQPRGEMDSHGPGSSFKPGQKGLVMGSPDGLRIYAVFVSNKAGLILEENARGVGGECCIISYVDGNGWTVLVISVMSVLAVISLVATILFTVNQLRDHRETGSVLDGKTVDMLPTITFGSANVIGRVGETCAICLEDFKHEEHLKVLPCQHDFHASCVNSWLTKWATFCPVCKHDLRTNSSIK